MDFDAAIQSAIESLKGPAPLPDLGYNIMRQQLRLDQPQYAEDSPFARYVRHYRAEKMRPPRMARANYRGWRKGVKRHRPFLDTAITEAQKQAAREMA